MVEGFLIAAGIWAKLGLFRLGFFGGYLGKLFWNLGKERDLVLGQNGKDTSCQLLFLVLW